MLRNVRYLTYGECTRLRKFWVHVRGIPLLSFFRELCSTRVVYLLIAAYYQIIQRQVHDWGAAD